MFLQAVSHIASRWFGRRVPIACISLLLIFTTSNGSSAGSPYPFGQANVLLATIPGGLPASDDTAGAEQAGDVRITESPIGERTFTDATSNRVGSNSPPTAENAAGGSLLHSADAGVRTPDWNGVWRDTGLLIGSQFVAAGLIYTMPEGVSGWSSEQKNKSFKKYADNVDDPVIDKDKFYINYILHPYWGATYYIRGRERGLNKVTSFFYSTMMSAMYEFGVECFFEKPSIQDLIVTPVAGSILGALLLEPLRESIKRRQELYWYDHVALVLTDPLGVLSFGFEKIFGIESTIVVDYSVPHLQKRSAGSSFEPNNNRIGAVITFPMD